MQEGDDVTLQEGGGVVKGMETGPEIEVKFRGRGDPRQATAVSPGEQGGQGRARSPGGVTGPISPAVLGLCLLRLCLACPWRDLRAPGHQRELTAAH